MLDNLRRGVARVILGATPVDDWNNINNPAVFNLVGLSRKTSSGVRINELTAMNIPVVWACVSILARQIAQCPIALYKRNGDQRERVDDHPISMLLMEPNTPAGLGMVDLLKQKQTSEGLWGAAYWQIERGNSGGPVALWPLESAVTTPLTGDAIDARGITGYDTLIGRKSERLAAADVVHFRGVTLTGYTGWSPVAAAAQAIGLTQAMEKFGGEFFANEAKSGGFVMHPGKLNAVGKEAIRKSVEDQARANRGPGNSGTDSKAAGTSGKESHRIKILDEGMKFVPTTVSPNESQFIESRNHQISEIARLYGVPLVLLQSTDGSTVWGTGIESLMLGFVNQTIRPILVASEDELSRKLLTVEERQDGYHIAFDYSVLLRGDSTARADYNNKGIEGGWLTPNEARVREGFNPLPGLDKPRDPAPKPAAPGQPGQQPKPPAKQPEPAE